MDGLRPADKAGIYMLNQRWNSLLLLGALAPAAGAQTVVPLALEGDNVTGVGAITRIDNIAILDDGTWLVEADTDNADTDADQVLLLSGVLSLRENDSLPTPVGAFLDTFDTINRNANGNSGWNFFLDGTSGSSDDSGVYFNTNLLIQESDFSTDPSLSAGTPYIGFFECKINSSDDIVVMASVDDPAISSTVDRVFVRLTVDGSGNLASETVLIKEGDVLPGQTEFVADLGTNPHNFAFNDNGDYIVFVDLNGDTSVDGAIYGNMSLLAQEGGPSPVAGRNYSSLSGPELDLNNAGDYVFSGSLDGDSASNLLIVKNGAKFRQEGDTLPDISPFLLTSFGSGPIDLDDAGNVLWYGDWDDSDTDVDTGLFLNDTLLVQEGVTTVGGVPIDTLRGVTDGYALSSNGRYVMFEAVLDDGTEGAFLIDLQEPSNFCTAAPNSTGLPGEMGWSGSTSVSANDFVLIASNLPAGQNGLFIYSETPEDPGVPLGNGNLCLSNQPLGFILRLPSETSDGGGVMTHALDNTAPPHPGGFITPGSTWYFSCWHRDNPAPPSFFNFADGLEVTFEP